VIDEEEEEEEEVTFTNGSWRFSSHENTEPLLPCRTLFFFFFFK
jgi:hypothetical protein